MARERNWMLKRRTAPIPQGPYGPLYIAEGRSDGGRKCWFYHLPLGWELVVFTEGKRP